MNVRKNAKLTPAGRGERVRRVLLEKHSVQEVSRAMGVSRRTVYKWVKRYETGGVSSLEDRSSRPRRSPRKFPRKLVKRIERLRRRRGTGLRIAEELKLAVSTVSLWLRRLGLGRLRDIEPKPVVVRYEKKRPGELLHLDTKKVGRIRGIGHRIHDFGQRVQNSVFECNMSWEQWTPLKARLLEAFEAEEDSLRLYFLGKKWRRRVEHYGVNTAVDMEGPLIV